MTDMTDMDNIFKIGSEFYWNKFSDNKEEKWIKVRIIKVRHDVNKKTNEITTIYLLAEKNLK